MVLSNNEAKDHYTAMSVSLFCCALCAEKALSENEAEGGVSEADLQDRQLLEARKKTGQQASFLQVTCAKSTFSA